ncbi:MAG: D-alanyl-D-alanine carboxypeptidase [Candidatus Paracaedibacteraceae bacterium]|nr:D-alanyl-D-alanine carboxypeptidase [Candidatus Paracaedibacteraceae bacterium]
MSCPLLFSKPSPTLDLEGRQFLVIDGDTDTVLFEHDADIRMYPSSMTKILTAYLIFEEVASGRISLNTLFRISLTASKAGGSKMYLPAGKTVSVENLIEGIFVASGNDACICAAENMAGSEEVFVDRMNQKLKEFGCKGSHFMNASGMPHPDHYSTCRDLYIIAKRLYVDFPQYRHFFAQQTFTFGKGTHKNLNRLLKTFAGADGLKTGHTKAGGYGVITSAVLNNQRIFCVFNGCKTMVERNRVSDMLMQWAYQTFEQVRIFPKGHVVANLDTWMASKPSMGAVLESEVLLTLPKAGKQNITSELIFSGPLEAPLKKGEQVGELILTIPEQGTQLAYPIYAQTDLEKANYFQRIPLILNYLLFGKNTQ